ncbi:Hsp20/alpha crystallin family protein [Ancylostoma caninum]|uniref:Hsp20/alpha crystallin family protein n=1 Tax=Ancylostoma caninum TaxID=29170 RepID=A0A368H7U0_ANCCA|nr:Hsp20/alpha crystallin family protein [Ancylostoma caninum]
MQRRMMHELDRMERGIMPYWRDADHSTLQVATQTQEVVNDDKKFAVSLDVSQFKPEELKVHIDGLTIEGRQEQKTEHGYIERSFVRKWALPEENQNTKRAAARQRAIKRTSLSWFPPNCSIPPSIA